MARQTGHGLKSWHPDHYPVSIWEVTRQNFNFSFKCGEQRKAEISWICRWDGSLAGPSPRTGNEGHLSTWQYGEYCAFSNSGFIYGKALFLRTRDFMEFPRIKGCFSRYSATTYGTQVRLHEPVTDVSH